MAKGKYQEWLTEQGLTRIKGWAMDGLTDEQIAHNMGISRKTLCEWKEKYSDICDTLKETKDVADRNVENALYQAALSGNTTAMIFWLKNRKPDKWRKKREEDTEDKNITVTIKGADEYGD